MRMHAVVRGRVQGVGFRWFVREAARALDLAGWVMNRRDGGVEIEAEGAPDAIESFHRALNEGPEGAHVDEVALSPASDLALERPFTIKR